MIRPLSVILALLVIASPAAAEWRPEGPDRLAAMDAEMAPLLVDVQPAFDAISADFTVMSAGYRFSGIEGAAPDMQARLDAAMRLPQDLDVALALARDALSVLGRWPPDRCWSQYWAVTMTGWLLYGDAADALRVGAMDDANGLIGAALRLLGAYGSLVHAAAVTDCAA